MKRGPVAVIGAGVMGCATARALAARGVQVTLLEQFRIGHSRGSSHGASRIFRFSYPDARYVAMAMEALPLWRSLEREVDEPLLTTTGGLDRGPALDDHVSALRSCGAACEVLDQTRARKRWPSLRFPDDGQVLFQPDSGFLRAERSVQAFAGAFTRRGGEVLEGVRASSLTSTSEGVVLETSGGTKTFECVVVTAGSWAKKLLATADIHLDVRPTRETVAYFDLAGPPPPTLVEWGDPAIYALADPGRGVKAGEHEAGPTTDPDEEGKINAESLERVVRWVGERFPGASPDPTGAETCLYTNTPDDHFVLKGYGRVVVGSPCSGHGFKFAPLIGERLAALVEEVVG
ncbi:MAG: FAD-dependent oxidoreductase [Actinomycetota bacterium]|nr:FAD-dependent oxidoreductase [Actinomycetota bacterium]